MSTNDQAASATIDRIIDAFQQLMQRQMHDHASDLNEIDVTMVQAKALYIVVAAEEIRMSDLAQRLGVTSSTATGLVDRLVELGLATRHEDAHDRRQVVIAATPKALAVLDRFRELNGAQMRHLLGFIDPTDLGVVERAVELMLGAVDAASASTAASGASLTTPHPSKGDHS